MAVLKKREKIEWLNYWIEDADQEKERILLIGDSVTRQYRKCLNSLLSIEGYVCDIIATSRAAMDEILEKELKFFFERSEYSYNYIVFHLGAHHGYWIQCSKENAIKLAYEKRLKKLLMLISDNCKQIITVSGTYENENSLNKEEIFRHNEEIAVRNSVLKQISVENKFLYVDLCLTMKKAGFKYTDWCHYERKADEYMANRIAEVLLGKKKVEILNQINSLKELNNIIDIYPNIYIYGCGKKGKFIESYLRLIKKNFLGYVVSEQYYEERKEVINFREFVQSEKKSIVIVALEDYQVFQELLEKAISYISLSERLNVFIEEYVNAYMENENEEKN